MTEDKKEQKAPSSHAEREETILKFWKENQIFAKTLIKQSPKGEFVFYEGPPTANGKPGIHHVEARSFKDVIPRFKTMQGFHVDRKAGWDTHGLPVELQVEKTLGFTSKKDIESYGIGAFNKKCKESVFEYIDLWKKFTERIGYWADMDDAYFTFHNSYIESLWGVVSKVNDQNLLYKDYRIAPWCPRCGTGLSSHELAQGYQDVTDISLYVKFKLTNPEKLNLTGNVYILAWTTTPWTLPGNVALAVGKDIDYDIVQSTTDGELYLVAKELNGSTINSAKEGLMVTDKIVKGSDLVGLSYEPLYPYLKDNLPESEKSKLENAFKVYAGDFVTTTDGTGIVHIAPMYGQDDFELATKNNLPKFHVVGEDGMYKDFCGNLAGRFVKEKDEVGKPTLDVDVIKYLQEKNFYFNKENYKHSYPHCWRCKTPLIYYARDSWYIGMSKLKDKLVAENQNINWEPDYIKEGRFGEWLREIKDWAISRERYWGTPLPVWISEDQSEKLVVDSIQMLKKYTKKSGNTYKVMRHGKTEKNDLGVWDFDSKNNASLSEEGRKTVKEQAEKLKAEGYVPDVVFVSPFNRTKETLKIITETLGITEDSVIEDPRLVEWNVGEEWLGLPIEDFFKKLYEVYGKDFHYSHFENGESYSDLIKRAGEFIYEVDQKYKDKKIFIVSHASVLKAFFALDNVLDYSKIAEFHNGFSKYKNAEIRDLEFVPLPHNDLYEIDLHKPFIDDCVLISDSGKELRRTKEVMDVWFDSGAMPFAQHAEMRRTDAEGRGRKSFDEYVSKVPFPADFISEAIDQTRGWFYTLHAVGVLMGKGNAYKNVICLGHLLDKNGKKMSKSLGNIVDPWIEMDKYGVDAIRLWMYSVNQPGEGKNYDEKVVDEINKKVFNLVSNVLTFYNLYRDKSIEDNNPVASKNVLDLWILLKLKALVNEGTDNMEQYKLLEPVRGLKDFIDNLSTWYVRRSRDRLRVGDVDAKKTLYFVLKTLSKYMAPFAPFYAESLYQSLRLQNDKESVHLEDWPDMESGPSVESEVLTSMDKVRTLVTSALEARQKANIKVRQPLQKITVKALPLENDYVEIIKDEINIKEVCFDINQTDSVVLDTEITKELKEEGIIREIIRAVQEMRKQKGLTPDDRINLTIGANENCKDVLEKPERLVLIRETVLAKTIEVKTLLEGDVVKVDDIEFSVLLSV